jgi:hypothetical protein
MAWVQPLLPIRDGLAIVLRLLRASGRPETCWPCAVPSSRPWAGARCR